MTLFILFSGYPIRQSAKGSGVREKFKNNIPATCPDIIFPWEMSPGATRTSNTAHIIRVEVEIRRGFRSVTSTQTDHSRGAG